MIELGGHFCCFCKYKPSWTNQRVWN